MRRRPSEFLSIDEVINLALAKLQTRWGRRIATVVAILVVITIAVIPELRSRSAPPADAASTETVPSVPIPHTVSLPIVTVPDTTPADVAGRIGPPLTLPTTTTLPPTTSTTSVPPTTTVAIPIFVPKSTAPPVTAPPPTTTIPDGPVQVPVGPPGP